MGRRSRFGGWSVALALLALAFNAALVSLAYAGAHFWGVVITERALDHHLTPATEDAARRAIETELATLLASDAPRREVWGGLVSRELVAGDLAAARGLLVSAERFLSPPDATRFAALLPPGADDDARTEAALSFLTDDVRSHFESTGYQGATGGAIALGDGADFAAMARAAASGETADRFSLVLLGIALTAPSADAERVMAGAALVRAARRAGALSPSFSSLIESEIARAAPAAAIEAAGREAAAPVAQIDPGAAAIEAFLRAIDPAGAAALRARLISLAELSEAAGAATAVRLLPFAQGPEDLPALRLIAAGGGDRAVAAAKYAKSREALLSLAPRTLKSSPALEGWGLAALAALLVLAASLLATLSALRRSLRSGPPPRSKAERRVRRGNAARYALSKEGAAAGARGEPLDAINS